MDYFYLILTLLASAFFSGLEFAFISANKLQVELKKKQGGILGRTLGRYFGKPSRFLATTLVGNNIALVLYSILIAKLLEPPLISLFGEAELLIFLCQTLISTIIILIVGEFIPKNLFRLNPNGIFNVVAIPFLFFYWTFWIFVTIVVFLAKILLRLLFGIDYKDEEKAVFGRVDLQHYLKEMTVHDEEDEDVDTNLFEKALELRHIKVRECMIPRPEIEAIEHTDDLNIIKQRFIETKHSKLIVYKDSIDHVIGYLHHQDLLKKRSKVWKIIEVPETMAAADLLDKFIKERKSIALVADEFGGTAGIVTLEDIIEEIFGEIRDEHDDESFVEQKIADNQYEFSARLEIDYLNEHYELNIPEGDYETLAGYIVNKYENIPQSGETIDIDQFSFLITEVSHTRIEKVKMTIQAVE